MVDEVNFVFNRFPAIWGFASPTPAFYSSILLISQAISRMFSRFLAEEACRQL